MEKLCLSLARWPYLCARIFRPSAAGRNFPVAHDDVLSFINLGRQHLSFGNTSYTPDGCNPGANDSNLHFTLITYFLCYCTLFILHEICWISFLLFREPIGKCRKQHQKYRIQRQFENQRFGEEDRTESLSRSSK